LRNLIKSTLPLWKQVVLSISHTLIVEAGVEAIKITADVVRFKIEERFGNKVFHHEEEEGDREPADPLFEDDEDDDLDFHI